MAEHKKLYLGAQNDAVFIIDTPPRPAPMDYLTEGDPNTNVIAKILERGPDAGKRLVAAHNALHSEDGRSISTEQIEPGLFWRMRDLLEDAGETIELLANRLGAPTESAHPKADAEGFGSWAMLQDIRALLDSLKVQTDDR